MLSDAGSVSTPAVMRGHLVTVTTPCELSSLYIEVADMDIKQITSECGIAAALEARRLADKYGKDFLDCDALVEILGVGRNNVRQLMCSEGFPTTQIGNRKVIGILPFVLWSMRLQEHQ